MPLKRFKRPFKRLLFLGSIDIPLKVKSLYAAILATIKAHYNIYSMRNYLLFIRSRAFFLPVL